MLLLLATLPLAAGPLAPNLAGSWALVDGPSPIPAAIERAVKDMVWIKRPFARSRLGAVNDAYASFRVQVSESEVTIHYYDGQIQHLPLDGHPVAWRRKDGEMLDVAIHPERGDLVEVYQAKDGVRTNVFHVDPQQGTLSLGVTLESSQLPTPVSYTLTYRAD